MPQRFFGWVSCRFSRTVSQNSTCPKISGKVCRTLGNLPPGFLTCFLHVCSDTAFSTACRWVSKTFLWCEVYLQGRTGCNKSCTRIEGVGWELLPGVSSGFSEWPSYLPVIMQLSFRKDLGQICGGFRPQRTLLLRHFCKVCVQRVPAETAGSGTNIKS